MLSLVKLDWILGTSPADFAVDSEGLRIGFLPASSTAVSTDTRGVPSARGLVAVTEAGFLSFTNLSLPINVPSITTFSLSDVPRGGFEASLLTLKLSVVFSIDFEASFTGTSDFSTAFLSPTFSRTVSADTRGVPSARVLLEALACFKENRGDVESLRTACPAFSSPLVSATGCPDFSSPLERATSPLKVLLLPLPELSSFFEELKLFSGSAPNFLGLLSCLLRSLPGTAAF